MKSKSTILGLVAFVLSIGSAFESINANNRGEVEAKVSVTFNNGTSWNCIKTDKFCITGSGPICRITVDLSGSTPDKTIDAHSNSACSNELTDAHTDGVYSHSMLPDDARDN